MTLLRCITHTALYLALATNAFAQAPSPPSKVSDEKNPWVARRLDRPWELRYWMRLVGGNWSEMKQSAIKFNAQPADVHMPTYNYLAMVDPTYTFTPFGERESHSLTPLEFNKDGVVISSNMVERPLKGQLATVGRLILLVLSEGDSKSDRQYPVSDWFHGFGDSSVDWAPTFCSTDEMPSPWSATDEFYKYGPKFKATDPVKPIFGCREWGYQLYDDMRPYIDVTSYAPKTKSHPHGTYIRPFVGWARFGDRKPVIGKDADTWYCLYDCPAGDQPGPIPDIAQWATRSGWPVPQRPTRAPTFPDAPGKQGRYVTSAPAQATGTR